MKNRTKNLLNLIRDAKVSRAVNYHHMVYGYIKGNDFYARCWAERFVKDSTIIIDSGYWSFSPQRKEICRYLNTWNPKRFRYYKYQHQYLDL